MSKDNKYKLHKRIFPDHSESDTTKESTAFGLQVGEAIQYEWFNRTGSAHSMFYDRAHRFNLFKRYARAEQPTQRYKETMAQNGDLSWMAMNWQIIPVLPKFVDIVVNGMSDRQFRPRVTAQDPMSQSERNIFQENVEVQMSGKDVLTEMQNKFGIDPFTIEPGDIPQNEEELDLYMQLNYKPAIELAEEVAIQTILDENRYLELKKQMDYDQVVLGVSWLKHEFNPLRGIELKYVDPENMVYGYTDDPHFRDCAYYGHIDTVPITEVIAKYGVKDPDVINKIKEGSKNWHTYHGIEHNLQNFDKENTATLLHFSYRTSKTIKYKKKLKNGETIKMIERDEDWNPDPELVNRADDFDVMERVYEVYYDGVMVAGTDIILSWELQKNMVRPDAATQRTIPTYIGCAPRMYRGRINSLLERMIPYADLIQLNHLKIQHVLARVVPDGVFIDADGLTEVDLGDGKEYSPTEALNMYFQTGSVVGRSKTTDDEFNHARIPIQELGKNSGASKIQSLLGSYNHYLDSLVSVIGLNKATDGSSPDERSLVGVQKMAALNSNTATRHILEAGISVSQDVCEAISFRLSDCIEYSDVFLDDLINKIGPRATRIVSKIKDLPLYSFGMTIQLDPDTEEKAKLEENIQRALDKESIYLEDAIEIREINNVKLANQLLKVKRAKRDKEQERIKQEQDARSHKMNMAQIKAREEADQKKALNDAKAKVAWEREKGKQHRQNVTHEKQAKSELMDKEFNLNMQLKGIEVKGNKDVAEIKEQGQKNRQAASATQQSRMIEQRSKDSKAIDFESEEDSLDGFDLAQFDPR